ncbi:type II secretion system protein [Patescibacteria group bacterium]|nr:type II secretion system protein [Patescibacteria group bacterium]
MKDHKKGFTLIEIVTVLGLMAIILIIVLASLNQSRMNTRDNLRISNIETIRVALEEYRAFCGVFPATLELDADNGLNGMTCSHTFGEFIPEIPTAPTRNGDSLLVDGTVPTQSVFNGYFYAALSTSLNGPSCYEYHLGAELEFATNNEEDQSRYLSEDHDFEDGEGDYSYRCASSAPDFGSANPATDDLNGLYDFRSLNNH